MFISRSLALLRVYKRKPSREGFMGSPIMTKPQSPVEPAPEYHKVDQIVERNNCKKSALIPILQEIEGMYGYLPSWALRRVSEGLKVPLIQVCGVASFYDAFHLTPQGENLVRVCLGTACYLKGGSRVLESVEKELGIKEGETTSDLKFSIQTVRCLGACALAPVMVIGQQYFDKMVPMKVNKILKQVQSRSGKDKE
jgi:NADH-quinone oxidoreductase subunit E